MCISRSAVKTVHIIRKLRLHINFLRIILTTTKPLCQRLTHLSVNSICRYSQCATNFFVSGICLYCCRYLSVNNTCRYFVGASKFLVCCLQIVVVVGEFSVVVVPVGTGLNKVTRQVHEE